MLTATVARDAIFLLLTCHELTGEQAFLDRADHFARTAIDLFIDDTSPLPRASTANAQYESVTRADTLMMAVLKLWARHEGCEDKVTLVCCDR
ncbi:MAG: hypothetical protein GY851_21165 [bacterium]|nr:hypothetical protein [bacterium]